MKLQVMCVGCQAGTVLRVLRRRDVSSDVRLTLVEERNAGLSNDDELGRSLSQFYADARQRIGIDDPLEDEKRQQNEKALSLLPLARDIIGRHDDPLLGAVRVAAVGNMIDFSFGEDFDVEAALTSCLDMQFAINDLDRLRERLRSAASLVLCTDNAGEVVFDRLLLDAIQAWRQGEGLSPLAMTVLVKGGPILNDALRADAAQARLGDVAEIMDTGSATAGILQDLLSPEARARIYGADIVLAKGMANFETTFEDPGFRSRAFFLLKAKCAPIATVLNAPEQSLILADGSLHDDWAAPA